MDEVVEHGEKRGEGFAGASGRGDQRRTALADQRPCARLGGGDRRERVAEPGADGGVKACQGRVRGDGQIHGLSYAGAGGKMQVPLGSSASDRASSLASQLPHGLMSFTEFVISAGPCGSWLASDGASCHDTNPGDLHFTDDGCALNPQNATIPVIIDDGSTRSVAKAIVPIRLGLLTLCECALCYWAAEMPLGRR
ncbi:hypothetical protein EMIT0P395_50063 [Pseudomonas sp. IT-P395]